MKSRQRLLVALLILGALASASFAPAGDVSWLNASGNVTNTAFWAGGILPGSGDTAWLTNSTGNRTATNNFVVAYGGLVISNRNTVTFRVASNSVLTVGGTAVLSSNAVLTVEGSGVVTNGNLVMVANGLINQAVAGAKTLVVTNDFVNSSTSDIDLKVSTAATFRFVLAKDQVATNNGLIRLGTGIIAPIGASQLEIGGTNTLVNLGTLDFGHRSGTGSANALTNLVIATLYNQGTVVVSNSAGAVKGLGSVAIITKTDTTVTNAGQWLLRSTIGTSTGLAFSAIRNGGFANLGTLRFDSPNGNLGTNIFAAETGGMGFTNAAGGQVISDAGANFLRADAIYNAVGGSNVVNGGILNLQGSSGGTTTFRNDGTLLVNGGLLAMNGIFTNAGMVKVAGGNAVWKGTVVLNGGSYLSQGGTNFFGSGVSVASGASLTADATSGGAITGLVRNSGTIVFSNTYTIAGVNPWQSAGGDNQFAQGLQIASGGSFGMTSGNSTVSGVITNAGTMSVVNGRVVYGGPVVLTGGRYYSDPSTNVFNDNFTVDGSSVVTNAPDDFYVFGKNFTMNSTNRAFDMSNAKVVFTDSNLVFGITSGVTNHVFDLSGSGAVDKGSNWLDHTQLATNFSIGTLTIALSNRLTLTGSVSVEDGVTSNALYVGVLDLSAWNTNAGISLTNTLQQALLLPNINLYYDKFAAENTYLHGTQFDLWSGGLLIPIPEPTAILAAASGLSLLVFLRRRNRP